MIEMPENKWSNWGDNNQELLSKIPEKPCVYDACFDENIIYWWFSKHEKIHN